MNSDNAGDIHHDADSMDSDRGALNLVSIPLNFQLLLVNNYITKEVV